jgi:RNA polymerase sigma factor (sigma-70 family)
MKTNFPEGFRCNAEHVRIFEQLERELRPRIAVHARRAQALGIMDFDDMVQEARLALLNVVARFNPERGELEHYARRALRLSFALACRTEARRRKREVDLEVFDSDCVDETTPERSAIDAELLERIASVKLTEREAEILGLRFNGFGSVEAGERSGLDRNQVNYTIRTLRRRLGGIKAEVCCHG